MSARHGKGVGTVSLHDLCARCLRAAAVVANPGRPGRGSGEAPCPGCPQVNVTVGGSWSPGCPLSSQSPCGPQVPRADSRTRRGLGIDDRGARAEDVAQGAAGEAKSGGPALAESLHGPVRGDSV